MSACQWQPTAVGGVTGFGWLAAATLRSNQRKTPKRARINMNNPKQTGKAHQASHTLLRLGAGLLRLRFSSQLLHNSAFNLAVLRPFQTVIYQRQGDMRLNELRRFFYQRF